MVFVKIFFNWTSLCKCKVKNFQYVDSDILHCPYNIGIDDTISETQWKFILFTNTFPLSKFFDYSSLYIKWGGISPLTLCTCPSKGRTFSTMTLLKSTSYEKCYLSWHHTLFVIIKIIIRGRIGTNKTDTKKKPYSRKGFGLTIFDQSDRLFIFSVSSLEISHDVNQHTHTLTNRRVLTQIPLRRIINNPQLKYTLFLSTS